METDFLLLNIKILSPIQLYMYEMENNGCLKFATRISLPGLPNLHHFTIDLKDPLYMYRRSFIIGWSLWHILWIPSTLTYFGQPSKGTIKAFIEMPVSDGSKDSCQGAVIKLIKGHNL